MKFYAIAALASTCIALSGAPTTRQRRRRPQSPSNHKRVVAIGDVHGDLDALRTCLRVAGVVDTQDAWIGAIKGALAPAMPLRLIVVRYEDLVLRTPEVSRALFAALNLPPTSRRRLALRGATTSSEHLWAFSAHAGGQPYAAAVHKCLADPRFTADVGRRLRGPLLAATGYDALRVDGADFVPLDTDLLASSLGPRFRAWLRSPATNRAAAMPPCASNVRVGRPLSVLRRAGA